MEPPKNVKVIERSASAIWFDEDGVWYALSSRREVNFFVAIFLTVCLALMSNWGFAQTSDTLLSSSRLKKLSLEELMNIEITSVSKRLEKLKEAASAIQVITQEDIHSSGVKTLPEALRLASNLQVAQVNSSQWAISARGFNNVLANKLLVLIDGRTVYTPLYAGVFWDAQNLILEDIDRIEVISGPGGTLWGANAVNGVINIITKSSKETQGLFVEGATGIGLSGLGSLRYGGKFTDNLSYRVYGTGFNMGNTILAKDSSNAKDQWSMMQEGIRLDWSPTKNDQVTLQANRYDDRPNPDGAAPVVAQGDNIIARWNRKTSEESDFQLQAYYDHTWRDFGNGFAENLKTYDLDWQTRYRFDRRNVVTCGMGIRLMDHDVQVLPLFAFLPAHKKLELYSAFVQDEIMLIKEQLLFTVGTKIEHNSYTGFEYQPNSRLTWTPTEHQTIWAAASRAVRTPSRIDRDFYLSLTPTLPVFTGGNVISEELLSYELGWRLQPLKRLSISMATFYNFYDNIRSAEPGSGPIPPYPITFSNGVKGETFGAELSVTYQFTDWWRLRGGYTFLRKHLWVKETSADLNKGTAESNDPAHQVLIQSIMKISGRIEFGTTMRYVDQLPKPYVPSYKGLDIHIGWKLNKVLELSVTGQNLIEDNHIEFIPSSPSPRKMQRSVYGKITCYF